MNTWFVAILVALCTVLTPSLNGIDKQLYDKLHNEHQQLYAQVQEQQKAIQRLPQQLHREMHVGFQVQRLAAKYSPKTKQELAEFGKQVVKIVQQVEHEKALQARNEWFQANWIFLSIFSLFMLCFPCVYVRTVLHVKNKRRASKKLS